MKKTIIFLTLFCFSSLMDVVRANAQGNTHTNDTREQRLDNLARQISDGLTENQKHTIAVVEFSDLKGSVTNLGRFLSEELITRLYQTKKFKVIERQQLNKIISEQKLSLTGIVDPASAQKLGRVLGVDSIVFGSVSDLVKTLRINARLISAETGEVFAAASIEINKDEAIASLMNEGISNVDGRSISSAPPQPSAQKSVKVGVFRFELSICKVSGDDLNCRIDVTNEGETDRNCIVYREKGSRAIDSSARELTPSVVWLGNKSSEGESWYNSHVGSVLVPGVPIKVVVKFKGASSDLSSLRLLRITFNEDESAKERYVDFRNISISK